MPHSGKAAATPQALVPDDDRSGPKPSFDVEAYNAVARTAKLRRIALLRSHFSVHPAYFTLMSTEKAPKPRYSGDFGKYYFDSEKGRATCEWKWGIKVVDKRKITLSIGVIYIIIYSGLENQNEDSVIRYLKRVGRFSSYPYFRAHVSQLNWESGANLPILPTIAT